MKPVSTHIEDCLAVLTDIPALDVPLADSVGSVLARDAIATVSLPPADSAARDGYAVHSAETASASPQAPVGLAVVGEILAGTDSIDVLPPRSAIRISSGATLPRGADAVVPIEATDGGRARVNINQSVEPGENLRCEAEDFEAGLVALEKGTRIGARQIAILAAAGLGTVSVKPAPRVAILSIGDDLVEPGRSGHPGTYYDANSHGLATAISELGAIVFRVPRVPDSQKELRDALQDQLVRSDVIITTGGLSFGGGDTVKDVVGGLGTVRFDRVAMTPVHQYGVGRIELEGTDVSVPIYCLPGNPVAALLGLNSSSGRPSAKQSGIRPRTAGRSKPKRSGHGPRKLAWKSTFRYALPAGPPRAIASNPPGFRAQNCSTDWCVPTRSRSFRRRQNLSQWVTN